MTKDKKIEIPETMNITLDEKTGTATINITPTNPDENVQVTFEYPGIKNVTKRTLGPENILEEILKEGFVKIATYRLGPLIYGKGDERIIYNSEFQLPHRYDINGMMFVTNMYDEKGAFLGQNPVCTRVSYKDAIKQIAKGFMPLEIYIELLKNGKSEEEIKAHKDILTEFSEEKLSGTGHYILATPGRKRFASLEATRCNYLLEKLEEINSAIKAERGI